jgi:hypothetical protein
VISAKRKSMEAVQPEAKEPDSLRMKNATYCPAFSNLFEDGCALGLHREFQIHPVK